jgi:SWI/SNF-related matrix-associated actin-dependent regulator of chromatin subfamily A containing DEAD/H box 1
MSLTQRAALDQLRFSKVNRACATPNTFTTSSSSSIPPNQPFYSAPPSQSRDATIPSRYFPQVPNPYGNVLVPSPSPFHAGTTFYQYQPDPATKEHDVATISTPFHANAWRNTSRQFGIDPLSAPSGFFTNSDGLPMSSRHPWGADDQRLTIIEEGPPRKRINRGSPHDSPDVVNVPDSPQIQRPGQRRRIVNGIDALSTSSDESMPDVQHGLGGQPRPRIVRGRRPSLSTEPPQSEGEDPKFTRFLVTMPLHSPSRVRTAWQQANGDVKKATALLSDPAWESQPPATTQAAEALGRVKEIDEATKAERAAIREKGKKSMIYANRSALENKPVQPSTPPPSTKTTVDLTMSSPLSPVIAQHRRKRIKKLVVDSESEIELTASEDERSSQPRQGSSDEIRALHYFNTVGSDALQELTGTHSLCSIIFHYIYLCRRLHFRTGQCHHRAATILVCR